MQCKVEICGVNTAKLPVLKNEETRELLKRSRAGDTSARETLISGNLRHPKIHRPGREYGRSVPSGLYRTH